MKVRSIAAALVATYGNEPEEEHPGRDHADRMPNPWEVEGAIGQMIRVQPEFFFREKRPQGARLISSQRDEKQREDSRDESRSLLVSFEGGDVCAV